ncbi:thioredoxin family protein [Thalassotalea sp. PS06]|uniref:thioredoxin family protein n=1 Tax=Thalassotalea sp. PS06 TaxID=2594005 RepID=UPI00116331EA|nr:thioredoxin family protein [Thalassotalea sp. PS06]QDP03073.1 thioredoxin family protein [Thalassotalea sp. PS06]
MNVKAVPGWQLVTATLLLASSTLFNVSIAEEADSQDLESQNTPGIANPEKKSGGTVTTVEPKDPQTAQIAETLPLYSKIYDDQRDPFADAVAAIALAGHTQRNVLIEIGGNWCTWCHKLDAFLENNPGIYKELHENFVLLKVNVSDSNENADFMAGLPPVLGYPHMYVSTGQGKVILSKDTAEFLDDGNYSQKAWMTFIERWQSANNDANISLQANQDTEAGSSGQGK